MPEPMTGRVDRPARDAGEDAVRVELARHQFAHMPVALAANVGIPIGTSMANDFPETLPRATLVSRSRFYDVAHLDLSLLGRVHVEDILRIDLQLPIAAVVFASNPMTGDLDPRADLSFIARVGVSITGEPVLPPIPGVPL